MGIVDHLRGSLSGLLYQAVSIAVGLLLTPVLLSALGSHLFGVWAVLRAIIAYESVSDLGIPAAIVAFVSSSQSTQEKNRLITTGVLVNTGLTLLAILFLSLSKDLMIGLLIKIPDELLATTQLAYHITVATLVLLVLARSLSAVLDSLQRVDVRFAVETVGSLVWAGAAWAALKAGLGLPGVMGASMLASGLMVLAMGISIFRVYPHLRFQVGLPRSELSRVIRYGLKV